MLSFDDLERHFRATKRVERSGKSWIGLRWPSGPRTVLVRMEMVRAGNEAYLGVIAGGASVRQRSSVEALEMNAELPPGCAVLVHDKCLWLRFLVPMERVTLVRALEMVSFVARECAPLLAPLPSPATREAASEVFCGFAA